ncbi:acyltransferase family protein [Nocardiopsis ansamitocini]|uniref:Acyltransferase 3 domain-containing protein n=1 Tax=Nocardiopsis ansamitocini TaxID=1670832 RepID=A0A9W6PA21_9ACTN|nr:acyltransferase [Nocardiopsis ansamitocini]GLU49753.1 hypothetical protein Nans01_41040 [Nocardiopsis ansamitocini]
MTEQIEPTKDAARADAAPAPPERLFFVDNLRILLTVLVVLHHVAVTYGNIGFWFYAEPAQDPSGTALDVLVIVNQAFFMGFFFMISAYFVPGSHDRRGTRAFVRERLIRLGIPLLLFLLLLRPLLMMGVYPMVQEMAAAEGAEMPFWLFYIVTWNPGPLWFVEVLLVFSFGYVLVRRFRRNRSTTPATAAPSPRPERLPGPWSVVGFVAGLALFTYVWRIVAPAQYWPVVGLPSAQYLPQYVTLFVVGLIAFRQDWFRRVPRSAGWAGFAVAAVALAGYLGLLSLLGDAATQPASWQTLVRITVEGAFTTGVILGLVVLFREYFNRQGRLARFLTENAFAVFVFHPLVLVGLGYAFGGWQAIAVAKFAVVGLLALPLCWALGALVRSLPYAKRVF